MATETLQKRIARLERKKAILATQEAILKNKQRKQRTSKLIELGGLVVKAKLDDLKTNELYGALLYIADELNHQPSKIEQFKSIGANAFQKENINKTPVILTFSNQPSIQVRKNIRDLGLKWNKLRLEWEGYTELDKLKNLLKNIDHKLNIIDMHK